MKVLFDTNIVLDFLIDRAPFSEQAGILFTQVEMGKLSGYLCATTVTTIYYLASKVVGVKKARDSIAKLLSLFEIAPVNRVVLETALSLGYKDFEDAVVHEAGLHVGVQSIVTRDSSGFKKAKLSIYTPLELIHILKAIDLSENDEKFI